MYYFIKSFEHVYKSKHSKTHSRDEKSKEPSSKIILSTRFSSNYIHKSNLVEEAIITSVCI